MLITFHNASRAKEPLELFLAVSSSEEKDVWMVYHCHNQIAVGNAKHTTNIECSLEEKTTVYRNDEEQLHDRKIVVFGFWVCLPCTQFTFYLTILLSHNILCVYVDSRASELASVGFEYTTQCISQY